MDGTHLTFSDATFDVAYSLSSIEHFGGVPGARQAVAEMARVLRPGGICVVATEWHLEGPPGVEVFSGDDVHAILDMPGLRLVQPIDDRVWQRYESHVVDLDHNALETPHMLVRKTGTVFTSVVAFLERTTGEERVHTR
jgi:SAM-dependent methyltransferase